MGEGAVGNTDVRGVNIRESWRDGCSGVATILKEQSFYTGITTSTLAQLVSKGVTMLKPKGHVALPFPVVVVDVKNCGTLLRESISLLL